MVSPPGARYTSRPASWFIGAELVQEDGDGTYSSIPAKDVAAARDDCGARGCVFPTTGTLQNGLLNEVQQDTGVFYSTDAQTALLGAPLSLSPTGTDVTPQNVYNQWDFNQTTAFGIGGALSGNAGKGNTPVVDVANDGVFVGTGSPIAGSGSYYQNDYDPSCNVSAIFEDDIACQGPWQRIRYDSAKIGGSGAIVPATTSATEPLLNTAVATTAGHDFAADGQLPSSTNTVRYVQGIRRIGDLELGRIIFRITDPAAFTASFTAGSGSEDTFCLDATGGDLDKGDFTDPTRRGAQDNPWRYYEGNAHECFEGSVDGALVKWGEFVNGDPNLGISLQNDVVGYAITFFNTTNATLFDVDLSDAVLENLALVDFTDANCPYTSYDGDQGGADPRHSNRNHRDLESPGYPCCRRFGHGPYVRSGHEWDRRRPGPQPGTSRFCYRRRGPAAECDFGNSGRDRHPDHRYGVLGRRQRQRFLRW